MNGVEIRLQDNRIVKDSGGFHELCVIGEDINTGFNTGWNIIYVDDEKNWS